MLFKSIAKYILRHLPISIRCKIQSIRSSGHLQLGPRSYIHPSVHLLGQSYTSIGSNSCISEGSWLNVNHRNGDKKSIEIGSNCFIGKNNFFTSGDRISIGDFTLTAIGCKFVGSSHLIEDPCIPYLLSGTTSSDVIEIGVNCFLGADSTVLGNVKIGHGSVIAANSFVLKDIPPFSLAAGNPAKVIKRYSFSRKIWLPISEISNQDEYEMPSETDYKNELAGRYSHIEMPWIAAGRSMGNL